MKIRGVKARAIKDTRGDKTIEVILKTDFGKFVASAPNGKSRGKFKKKPYKKSLIGDIKTVNRFKISEIKFEKFDDLKNVERVFRGRVGANTIIAIEYCFLKALAKLQKKQVWQVINSKARKIPMPVGNAIGGGAHSSGKKPDFQEFLFIPKTKSFRKAVKINKITWDFCKTVLRSKKTNDENALQVGWSNEELSVAVLNFAYVISKRKKIPIRVGIDAAASQFYKNGKYYYENLKIVRNRKQQIELMKKLGNLFFYLEDPVSENDFDGFKEIKKKTKNLIVGDDLTVTNLSRIKRSVKSINAVIIKPNQCGSLIEVKKIVEFCKRQGIKTIFSHRSGETKENILADLCFGFGGDFIKCGIIGRGRSEKLKRMIKIENSL